VAKKGKASKRRRFRALKLALFIAVVLLGITFIPREFIPARLSDLHRTLVDARKRGFGTAKREGGKAATRVADGIPEWQARTSSVTICSFNIQFLGSSKSRDDTALASILADYDIVVVQELVAPPYPAAFTGGKPVKPDPEAAEFFDAMIASGFEYWLSEEDTGTGFRNHSNGSNTEWWVTFYRKTRVKRADDLPHGFLAEDRSNNPDFERVPYAFSFRAAEGKTDFVLISVHLQPGGGRRDKARRKHEIGAISAWIGANDDAEKDFIILGDCNIENAAELADATPAGFLSLNDECRPTNTNINGPKPYDHIFYQPAFTSEIDQEYDMVVVDLIEAMRPLWTGGKPFPGEPYDHNEFRKWYSDHHPVVFRVAIGVDDD